MSYIEIYIFACINYFVFFLGELHTCYTIEEILLRYALLILQQGGKIFFNLRLYDLLMKCEQDFTIWLWTRFYYLIAIWFSDFWISVCVLQNIFMEYTYEMKQIYLE